MGQRYPSKVFCLLIYGKILIPQKTKFSVQCINFAANGLFTHCNQWFLTVAKILLKKIDRNNLWCMHGTKLRIIDNSELVYFLGETLSKEK